MILTLLATYKFFVPPRQYVGKIMKKSVLSVICANLLFLQNLAYAEHEASTRANAHNEDYAPGYYDDVIQEYYDQARVVDVQPIIERLYAPAETCSHPHYRRNPQQQSQNSNDDMGNFLLGGLLGAAAGSAIGKGDGKKVAAGLGAILGAKIATGGDFTGEEILGALIGGAAGSQIGKGSGAVAGTAAGALAGAAIADGLVSRDRNEFTDYCGDQIVSRRVVTGFDVEFEYNGYSFYQTMPYRPQRFIDVAVQVSAIEDLTR